MAVVVTVGDPVSLVTGIQGPTDWAVDDGDSWEVEENLNTLNVFDKKLRKVATFCGGKWLFVVRMQEEINED